MPKSCFVIMPIGGSDSEHFRAIFEQFAPVLRQRGYDEVVRADDVQKGGAITKDIVKRLGEADLVIADLTNLNPNVMYELGVRHALRGLGTIMVLDENKTPAIPFDLSAYRVIKFVGELKGIARLREQLDAHLVEFGDTNTADVKDNPVHDWFPTLPPNVILKASESSDAPLREIISQLQSRLSKYEKTYGTEIGDRESPVSPLSHIETAISDADAGILPSALFETAQSAFDNREVAQFLKVVKTVVERNVRVGPDRFGQLSFMARLLTLDNVQKAILAHAVELYPRAKQLAATRMTALAHSDDPGDVQQAIDLIPRFLNIRDKDGVVNLETAPNREGLDLSLIAVLLDAYYRAGLNKEALGMAGSLLKLYPHTSVANRNYARALEKSGRIREAMSYYREAVLVDDVNDSSAVWLGNELHNRDRPRHAAEAYALACVLDPADATNFSHLMDELADCHLNEAYAGVGKESDEVANDIFNLEIVLLAFRCAVSCPGVGNEALERLNHTVRKLETEPPEQHPRLTRAERLEFARRVYTALKSELTTKGTNYDFDGAEKDAGRAAAIHGWDSRD